MAENKMAATDKEGVRRDNASPRPKSNGLETLPRILKDPFWTDRFFWLGVAMAIFWLALFYWLFF